VNSVTKENHLLQAKTIFKKFLHGLFGFFASLKLAVFLLAALGTTLACGTIIESLHGAKAAQQVIYHSLWFNLLLAVLGINVASAALDRLPWQKRHIGFLMTHAGILLILLGSWMTHEFAVEGELALAEGEKGARITLDEPLLQIVTPTVNQSAIVTMKPTPFRWQGRRSISLPDTLDLKAHLLAYYPHAEATENVLPKPGGRPAIQINLFNRFMKTGGWLMEGDPERDTLNLGPAAIRFSAEARAEESQQDSKGFLMLQHEGKETKIAVSEALEKEHAIAGTPYFITVKRYLPHALVENSRLVNQSEEPVNPACEILITGRDLQEAHTVFARFPDFPTIHGLKPSRTGIKIRYVFPAPNAPSLNELRILKTAENKLLYQVKTRGAVSSQTPLEIGKEYPTGWMDLKFQLKAYYPEAVYESSFEPRPMPTQGKSPNEAALVEFEKGKESRKIWLTRGQHEIFFLDGTPYHITYGHRSLPLDFEVELKDFMVQYDPGTTRPASFQSKVLLEDTERGVSRETMISMNKPLSYRGFKIYQAAYQMNEGEPDISVFQVGRDPGIPVKYTGSMVMILGIVTMFYMKRFSNPKPLYEPS